MLRTKTESVLSIKQNCDTLLFHSMYFKVYMIIAVIGYFELLNRLRIGHYKIDEMLHQFFLYNYFSTITY